MFLLRGLGRVFSGAEEGAAKPALRLMLETDLLLSLFPDLERVFGERNPLKESTDSVFLSFFGIVDRLVHVGASVSESVLAASFPHSFSPGGEP